ncbi:hypothetical protein FXV91_12875 [Methanosarcina sp. DH2]|uniref:hypothetical protein n=1 Tax=Methanosarcina sp. DH2 TaxID=2605639 RepID=UPI001E5A1997|nr:hypothetical protein [Methanosarcina sp. DH2]MCC4771030.1 hypothetical protein [Methanosarcina sp. DH2]
MTVRMTITMPDDLKSLINDYNTRNTFNKLVVSQVARRAIIEFIRTNDPDLISEEAQVNQCKQKKQEIPQVTEDQDSEESLDTSAGDQDFKESPDTSVDASEFVQEVVQDFQDTEVLLTEGKEFTCERCRALFTSKSPNARFCSPECMQTNQGENNGK